jgi:hypothetical protein
MGFRIYMQLINSEMASQDPLWRAMQTHEDIPYRVFNISQPVFDAWTRLPDKEPNNTRPTGFLHADRLLRLHDMVIQRPLIPEQAMIEWGETVASRDQALRKAYEESLKKRKGRKKTKHITDGDHQSVLAYDFAKKASSADTLKEIQIELDATLARLSSEDETGATVDNAPIASSALGRTPSLVGTSRLARMRIGSSASTKLNYIINEACSTHLSSPRKFSFTMSRSELTDPQRKFSSFPTLL